MVFIEILIFLVSIGTLWFSSDMVTKQMGPIAARLGVSELVVTVLGVSVLSSLPELTISAFAIGGGNAELSIGNVIGSNFVTLTFVTAVCALIRPIDIEEEVRERESSWMILSSAMVLMLSLDGKVSRLDGIILILLYLPYIISVIKVDRNPGAVREAVSGKIWPKVLISLAAIGGIILGAKYAIDSGQRLGERLGIPALALGVILFAFGTSLPELSISLAATLKKKASVTIGEVYASNIFTQLVVLGICALISPIAVSGSMLSFAMPFLILAAVIIQLFITSGRRLRRLEALLLLGFYAVFAVASFFDLPSLDELVRF
jgi:cation:H+ antiporter